MLKLTSTRNLQILCISEKSYYLAFIFDINLCKSPFCQPVYSVSASVLVSRISCIENSIGAVFCTWSFDYRINRLLFLSLHVSYVNPPAFFHLVMKLNLNLLEKVDFMLSGEMHEMCALWMKCTNFQLAFQMKCTDFKGNSRWNAWKWNTLTIWALSIRLVLIT